MAQSIRPENNASSSVSQQRFVIPNNHGEKLVGLLHETGSKKLVILCHGFTATKEHKLIVNLGAAISSKGLSVVCFDFSGNGESEGAFEFGNYWKEAEDLHAVAMHFSKQNYEISAIVGHSKGGDVVLLYASRYRDVNAVINLSGRLDLQKGIDNALGKEYLQRIKKDGFLDVVNKANKTGKPAFRVTEESLMDRLKIDMHAACLSIDEGCRVLTVHGSADEIIPVEDAFEIAKLVRNHKLHVIEGANHIYSEHQEELASVVVDFLTSTQISPVTLMSDLSRHNPAIVSFSNRCFWTKAISLWTSTGDADHAWIVGAYFHYSGGFEPPVAVDISPNPGRSDPMYVVYSRKQSSTA